MDPRLAAAIAILTILGIIALILAAIRAAKAGDDGADELAEGNWPHVPRGAGASHQRGDRRG